jgi:membrane protease YdiL (CAAX protease family)
MTVVVYGRAGVRELLSRTRRWRVAARWYAVALLLAPSVFIVVHLSLSLASPLFLPSIITVTDPASLVLSSSAVALAVGFFEELGWTGFATHHLRSCCSVPTTGVMVGVTWGGWHLLTNDFWIANRYSGDVPEPLFVTATALSLLVGQLPAYRVLMVWVYDRTGSLLVATLMHASLSACTFILGPANVTGLALVMYGLSLAVAWWIIVAIVGVVTRIRATRYFSRQRQGRNSCGTRELKAAHIVQSRVSGNNRMATESRGMLLAATVWAFRAVCDGARH